MTVAFQYHPDIIERFPNLSSGVILARGMNNAPSPDGLVSEYMAEQQAVIAKIGGRPLSELPSLAAWRTAFRAFGVEPTQYRCAAEALLRRLTKKGDIPSINTLVDIGNLVSIRSGLPIAVVDTVALEGTVTVHFADGSERFLPLGEAEAEHPEVGEVVFTDPTGRVIARRWCWRQSDDSAARETTTDAIITIEAQHEGGSADVQAAIDDLTYLLRRYAGGGYIHRILGRSQLGIEWE